MSDLDDDPSVSLDNSPLNNPEDDDHNTPDREDDGTSIPAPAALDPPAAPPPGRRGHKRKKPLSRKQRDLVEKKLRSLKGRLRPVPFVPPAKSLDLGRHEGLFRRLGLWEFAHIVLDREIREDLLVQLIAGYNSASRSSLVNDLRIKVSRADLARALKLPVKKEKTAVVDVHDLDAAADRAALAAVEDFVSYYVLLHEEDTWMMPDEVSSWVKVIKEGQPHKLDVAGLIWFMVEKELSQGQELEYCYYASHLQYMMKFQRPALFFQHDEVVTEEKDREEKETADAEIEEVEAEVEVITTNVADEKLQEAAEDEAPGTELSLGFDNGDDDQEHQFMGDDDRVELEECKEEDTYQDWVLQGKMSSNNVSEHHLRRCDSLNMKMEEEDERFELPHKFARLDSLRSADFIQDMGGNVGSYNIHMDLNDHQSGGLMGSNMELLKGSMSSLNHGGPLLFQNSVGRVVREDDGAPHFSCADPSANIGIDVPWENRFSSFDNISNQVQSGVLKMRKMFAEKENEYHNALMQIQSLNQELLARNQYIQSLEEARNIEQNKREYELQHCQKELVVVTELLHGYKKALRITQEAFAEYRERNNRSEDSIYQDVDDSYKDVDDPPGLVLSIDDLDKLRLKKEEENRIIRGLVEEMVKEFEQGLYNKFSALLEQVDRLADRFNQVETNALVVIRKIEVSKPSKPMSESSPNS